MHLSNITMTEERRRCLVTLSKLGMMKFPIADVQRMADVKNGERVPFLTANIVVESMSDLFGLFQMAIKEDPKNAGVKEEFDVFKKDYNDLGEQMKKDIDEIQEMMVKKLGIKPPTLSGLLN